MGDHGLTLASTTLVMSLSRLPCGVANYLFVGRDWNTVMDWASEHHIPNEKMRGKEEKSQKIHIANDLKVLF